MKELAAAIARVVSGDMKCLSAIRSVDHSFLEQAAASLPRLVLSRAALMNVLQDWRSGAFGPEEVQRWASFVRRGYVSRRALGPVRPIAIDYDPVDESLIVDIISRLDEIGDLVEGHVSAGELERMISSLSR